MIRNVDPVQELVDAYKKTERQLPWLEGTLIGGLLLIAAACVIGHSRDQWTVVLARDISRGDALTGADLVLAPLPRMSGTFDSACGLPGKVAIRPLEAGQPLREEDIRNAAKTAMDELEVPLRVFAGALRPRPGDSVRLAAVSADGEAVVVPARVLSFDAQEERAILRAAMQRGDAERIATLRSAQIRLLMEPKGRP